jgi:hypothetical protein
MMKAGGAVSSRPTFGVQLSVIIVWEQFICSFWGRAPSAANDQHRLK